MRQDDQKVFAAEEHLPAAEAQRLHTKDHSDPWPVLSGLARVQAAGAYAAAGALTLFAAQTLRFGERASSVFHKAASRSSRPGEESLDDAANDAMGFYCDYVRELAALPGIVGMSYFDHLDQLRGRSASPPAKAGGDPRFPPLKRF